MGEFSDINYLEGLELEQPEVVLELFTSKGELEDTYIGYAAIEKFIHSQEWKNKKKKYDEAKSNKDKKSSEEVL